MVGPPNQACFDLKSRAKSRHLCLHKPLFMSLLKQGAHSDLKEKPFTIMFLLTLPLYSHLPRFIGGPFRGKFSLHKATQHSEYSACSRCFINAYLMELNKILIVTLSYKKCVLAIYNIKM